MKKLLLKTYLRAAIKIFTLVFLITAGKPSYSQCLAGSNTANLNWDNLDYLVTTGNYAGFVTAAMSQTQAFAIGVNRVVIFYPASITTTGENVSHTGEAGSFGTGADVQYGGNGNITFTFDTVVNNFQFSLYDIDASQQVNITAVNALGVAQIITMAKPAGGTVTITGSGTTNAQGVGAVGATANTSNLATINMTITGPVKTVTVAMSGTAGDFWLSDFTACVVGTFPNNYFVASQPFTGQPTYVIGTSDTNTVSLINVTTGQAKMIFQDATSPRYINGLGYDHLQHNLYYVLDFTATPATNKMIKKYNFDTQTMSVLVPDVTALGIPTYNRGVESAGCAFYDNDLYFGVEGNLTPANNGGRETIIWRIEFNVPGGIATKACQVYATPSDNGAGTSLHDWNDFTLADGLLVDFAGSPNAAARRFTHYDLQTQNIVQNYFTGGLTPRQAGITWNNTRYWVYDGIAVYNMDGTIGPQTPISGATVLDWTGFCGDATGFRPKSDFGDAPASYDPVALSPALHEKDTALRLGPTWDEEFDKTSSALADADGADEDGISTVNLLDTALSNYVAVVRIYNNTGANATLIGWLDINGNGIFEASEGRSLTVPAGGPVLLSRTLSWLGINTPLTVGQNTFLRIRLTRAASGMTTSNATGYYNNGEVEDYPVYVFYILPVDLVSFNAKAVDNNSVKIDWTSEHETNLDHYEIQRSADAISWNTISSVAANNLEELQNYSTWDHAPLKGHSYYRLRIIGNAGSADKYSAVRNIYINSDKLSFGVMPNPAKDHVRLEIQSDMAQQVLIKFYDISGRTVQTSSQNLVAGSNTVSFNEIVKWPPGTYLVAVHAGNESALVQRFTVIK
jgi:GEVED domain/Secretion system C-terminal sorting domain